jgi:hypothetical protein
MPVVKCLVNSGFGRQARIVGSRKIERLVIRFWGSKLGTTEQSWSNWNPREFDSDGQKPHLRSSSWYFTDISLPAVYIRKFAVMCDLQWYKNHQKSIQLQYWIYRLVLYRNFEVPRGNMLFWSDHRTVNANISLLIPRIEQLQGGVLPGEVCRIILHTIKIHSVYRYNILYI